MTWLVLIFCHCGIMKIKYYFVLQEEQGHIGEVFCLAMGYCGNVLVSGSKDGTCVLWKHT